MKFGTKEWAEINKNIFLGCIHNCKYCYARYNALIRYKQIHEASEWIHPLLDEKKFNEKPVLYKNKRIMYPTQHDIIPEALNLNIQYLKKWLEVGNQILIVSKPHFECIQKICDELKEYKQQIVFRFTIGSPNNDVLIFWEPGAPDHSQRKASLIYAFERGFQTSVSCEPILDEDISMMVYDLLPYITDSIWLGKMNFISPRVDTSDWTDKEWVYMKKVEVVNKKEFIEDLYAEFKNNPKVRWKESIKKVLGLPDEEIG
jgi:DNA repair photolyase